MKKIVIWLCAGMMLLGLGACGSGEAEQGKDASVENSEESEGSGQVGGNETSDRTDTGKDGDNKMLSLKSVIVGTIGQQNYYPDTAVEPDQLEEIFGIAPEMYDNYLAEVSRDGTNVDTLLIIEAKDDKVEAVQEALFAYREAKEKDILEDSRNIGKVLASRIETNSNYVSFVQLGGDVTAALTSGEEAVIEQCLEMNELVLEVIAQNVH